MECFKYRRPDQASLRKHSTDLWFDWVPRDVENKANRNSSARVLFGRYKLKKVDEKGEKACGGWWALTGHEMLHPGPWELLPGRDAAGQGAGSGASDG